MKSPSECHNFSNLAETIPWRNPERIVCIGDSITDAGGYVEQLRPYLPPNVNLTRHGLSGGRARDLWTGKSICAEGLPYRTILETAQPTILFLYIGINDAWHEPATPLDEYERTLTELVQAAMPTRVILATPALLGERRRNPKDGLVDGVAMRSRQVAQKQNITLCDLRSQCRDYLQGHNRWNRSRGILTTDGVHMNDRGNTIIATAALQSFAQALIKQ